MYATKNEAADGLGTRLVLHKVSARYSALSLLGITFLVIATCSLVRVSQYSEPHLLYDNSKDSESA